MQLTGTSFLTWEEAQTALQATKQIPAMSVNERRQHLQTKFNPRKSEEDKRNLFEKEVRELALKRRLARSALDTNTIERNEDEQTAKMTYWDRQTSSLTNSGPTTRYGETLVSLDTTAELARSFRNEVLGKLKQADSLLEETDMSGKISADELLSLLKGG
jgi:hypothetical protein